MRVFFLLPCHQLQDSHSYQPQTALGLLPASNNTATALHLTLQLFLCKSMQMS